MAKIGPKKETTKPKAKVTSISLYDAHIERLRELDGDHGLGLSGRLQQELGVHWGLMKLGLRDAQQKLSRQELSLILDCMNGMDTYMTLGDFAGGGMQAEVWIHSGLIHNVYDSIGLDKTDEKWEVDGKALIEKLQAMDRLTIAGLLNFVSEWWNNRHDEKKTEAMLAQFASPTSRH